MPAIKLMTGFLTLLLDKLRRFFFRIAADLADHDDGLGFLIVLEQRQHIDKACAIDRIAADADTGRLTKTQVSTIGGPLHTSECRCVTSRRRRLSCG